MNGKYAIIRTKARLAQTSSSVSLLHCANLFYISRPAPQHLLRFSSLRAQYGHHVWRRRASVNHLDAPVVHSGSCDQVDWPISTLPRPSKNSEFGIVSHASLAIVSMAQYPDDDPIYFQAKSARAAAWRTRCKKIALLFQHLQIDLEFTSAEDAHAFLHVIEDIAMAAGNHFFYSYEVPQ